ncbi:MAG: HD-GYP domain-containing protein [Deltaproteobacteria bacterium]|nr:HD-GYP domain-containing protein [Deltaproteobacteria bacterium]
MRVDIDQIKAGAPLGFGLYRSDTSAGRVLGLAPDQEFTSELKKELIEAGKPMYMIGSEREGYLAHLETNFDEIIRALQHDPQKATQVAHDLTRHVMEKVMDSPNAHNVHQATRLIRGTVDLIIASQEALFSLLLLAEHDYYTYTHSCNVGLFGTGLVKSLIGEGLQVDAQTLGAAFFFHDIGKSEVGLAILNKPGPLDPEEKASMQQHTEMGLRILKRLNVLTTEARYVVFQHHERLDGSGYPQGLAGEAIHPFARICAIADVYDALTSDRAYRPRMAPFEALSIMREKMANHFDPEMLYRFIQMFQELAAREAAAGPKKG